jgi:hypothetical protein
LLDAQKTLQVAERATEVEDIQQLGYLAERKSQTAEEIGLIRKTEQEAQALTKETSDMQLQKRSWPKARELDKARQVERSAGQAAEVQAGDQGPGRRIRPDGCRRTAREVGAVPEAEQPACNGGRQGRPRSPKRRPS